tara:strand:- start:1006 stop:1323 length:318 start_codon:yes stop_codon:yes gene_type:complete
MYTGINCIELRIDIIVKALLFKFSCLPVHRLFLKRERAKDMNLLFLGTSAGVPTKSRNVSGIALRESKGKGWYLIDCGEGTQHQVFAHEVIVPFTQSHLDYLRAR